MAKKKTVEKNKLRMVKADAVAPAKKKAEMLKPEKWNQHAFSAFIKKRMTDLGYSTYDVSRKSHSDLEQQLLPEHVWRLANEPDRFKSVRTATLERLSTALRVPVETFIAVGRGAQIEIYTLTVDLPGSVITKLQELATHHGLGDAGQYLALLARMHTAPVAAPMQLPVQAEAAPKAKRKSA